MQRIVTSVLAALLATAVPASARAFCQTYTCEFENRGASCDYDRETGCNSGGVVAHWGSSCISYAVQGDGSIDEDISADELRQLVDEGFAAWTDADCSDVTSVATGATPDFTAVYRGETECDSVEYNCGEGDDNANIVMFRDGDADLSTSTIALSTIIANLRTGEILDVDIEINSQDFDFYIDPSEARRDSQDLRIVINHELGHMLGLSHTFVPGSLMRAAYDSGSPLPAPDDVAGMCAVFGASRSDPECDVSAIEGAGACVGPDSTCPAAVQPREDGCTVATAGDAAPAAGLGVFFLAFGASLVRVMRPRRRRG